MELKLRAELTVEAAVVMSIVLLSIMGLILLDFELHDKLAAANQLICTVEMYSHRNKTAAWADDYWKMAEDTDIYIGGKGQPVELRPGLLADLVTGTVCYGDETWILTNRHLPAESLLRLSTLSELTKKLKKKKGSEDTSKNKQEGGN